MTEKKSLDIPELEFTNTLPDLSKIADTIEKHGTVTEIGEVNWQDYSYRPKVYLFSGYTNNEILLKYRVTENHIQALHTEINADVFEDSCVEFFITCGNGNYYNFEFNCIGTPSTGYGRQRNGRLMLGEETVSRIRTYSTLGNEQIDTREMNGSWDLTIAIPFNLFKEAEYKNPPHHMFNANFYKCGDKLPVPHYLSWNRINAENPDFHRSEFFGELHFI